MGAEGAERLEMKAKEKRGRGGGGAERAGRLDHLRWVGGWGVREGRWEKEEGE